jgi:hypothetical protein
MGDNMVTFAMEHPTTGRIIRRNVYASQAQMVIDAMRDAGWIVTVISNTTNIVVV